MFPIRVTSSVKVPVLNPVLHVLHYRYPVQHITAENEYWQNWQKPHDQVPTILAGFRDKDYQVHFAELNTVTARLVELLQGEKRNQEHILLQLAAALYDYVYTFVIWRGRALESGSSYKQISKQMMNI